MAKKKVGRKLKTLFLASQALGGIGAGIPLGLATAEAEMAEIITPQIAARSPQLVNLATEIITGSSAVGGAISALTSGVILLKLYESGKIHLPSSVAKELRMAVGKLESGLKREGIIVRQHLEGAKSKLGRVI